MWLLFLKYMKVVWFLRSDPDFHRMVGLQILQVFRDRQSIFIRTVHPLLMKLLSFMYVHKCLQELKVLGTACTAECLHQHLACSLHIKLVL